MNLHTMNCMAYALHYQCDNCKKVSPQETEDAIKYRRNKKIEVNKVCKKCKGFEKAWDNAPSRNPSYGMYEIGD